MINNNMTNDMRKLMETVKPIVNENFTAGGDFRQFKLITSHTQISNSQLYLVIIDEYHRYGENKTVTGATGKQLKAQILWAAREWAELYEDTSEETEEFHAAVKRYIDEDLWISHDEDIDVEVYEIF